MTFGGRFGPSVYRIGTDICRYVEYTELIRFLKLFSTGNCSLLQKIMTIEKNETFFVFQNKCGTVPVNYVFLSKKFRMYVHRYVPVHMDEHKIMSERVIKEQSHQVSSNSSIGVTFPLTVYNFFGIGSIKYFRPLGYTTKNIEFIYLYVMHDVCATILPSKYSF